MAQCAAVDYAIVAYSVFPFEFRTNFLSDLLGFPVTDFRIIAISEFLVISGFLIVSAESYSGRLSAYVGDNTNVASRIMRRKPRNRDAQYLIRALNRLEAQFGLTVSPCYISTINNIWCDDLSRLSAGGDRYADHLSLQAVGALPTLCWYREHRLTNLSLILPSDPPGRVRPIMQFAEKRKVRRIPRTFTSRISWLSLGKGVNHRGSIFEPLTLLGICCNNIPRSSEVALCPGLRDTSRPSMARIVTFAMPRSNPIGLS